MKVEFRVEVHLKELLKRRGITITQLSEMTGIAPAAISRLGNRGGSAINYNYLERIAKVLDIRDIRQLLTIEKVMYDD